MNNIFNFINLHSGEEQKDKVLENVTSNISFRGSNLWILACAIIIASVGLNVNSTAVIIGAMLISPLMGPIVGAGFALGTYNFPLLKKSFKNLIIATVVSLLVSALYFYISPFKDVQSELLARTSPNIYDVLIAFFGGLVGVIAITRVEKGNPIPGVAIATALMPPLCTAGFGIATFNISYFAGAFYLYTINCFFICIATFLVVKYLKCPSSIVDSKYEKRIRYSITLLIIVMIVPSSYLAYNLFNEKKFTKTAELFLQKEFEKNGYTLIYKKINYNADPRTIDVAFLNKKFTTAEIESYNKMLTDIRMGEEVFHTLRDILKGKGYYTGVGDEGGFAPNLKSNEEAVDVILEAITKAGFTPGKDLSLCLDPATSEMWNNGKYEFFKSTKEQKTSEQMIELWESWTSQYPIVLLEDGLGENDWKGWQQLTERLGSKVELVGDDIFCTNPKILQEGIDQKIGNSVLIKLNQIGTVTETLETINLAYKNNYNCFISHRSGETEDTTISDLTVAVGAGHLKTGSGCRSERISKFNQLLRIEEELGNEASFAGIKAFK